MSGKPEDVFILEATLPPAEKAVLDVLDRHPDWIFGTDVDSLETLRSWVQEPDTSEAPRRAMVRPDRDWTLRRLRRALRVLRDKGLIFSISFYDREYFGHIFLADEAERIRDEQLA